MVFLDYFHKHIWSYLVESVKIRGSFHRHFIDGWWLIEWKLCKGKFFFEMVNTKKLSISSSKSCRLEMFQSINCHRKINLGMLEKHIFIKWKQLDHKFRNMYCLIERQSNKVLRYKTIDRYQYGYTDFNFGEHQATPTSISYTFISE